VIIETIRLSYGVATRLARVAPDQTLHYSGTFKDKPVNYAIPPKTAIGMTSVIMHADERIFPQADEFIPDRWLKKDGTRRTELERYLLSFSKGTRQCVGMK
jgi:cytochrome P450